MFIVPAAKKVLHFLLQNLLERRNNQAVLMPHEGAAGKRREGGLEED